MAHRIYLSPPDVGPAEQAALDAAFASGWIAPLGPDVDAFERELAAYAGRAQAVALSSGTAALHLGLLSLGAGPGDVVVTTTMTFAATVNAILYTGAEPVLVDCDAQGGMDVDLLAEAVTALVGEGRRIAAIVPVDLLGRVVDHQAVAAVAQAAGVPVLSDAAESLGSRYQGRSAAGWGDLAAVSFNGNKVMTTSGGGALFTDDEALAARVRYLSTQARQPTAHYEHTEVGYNYRLSNLLAALGRAQLRRLDTMVARRQQVREVYRQRFAELPGVSVFPDVDQRAGAVDNCWLTALLLDPALARVDPTAVRLALERGDIESRPLWKPMHRQPAFARLRVWGGSCAERLFARGLALPSGSSMTEADIERVVASVLHTVKT